jgi:hypothetical protein
MQLLPERLFTHLPTYTCLLNLTLLPLPTGSPELNPTKQVWQQLRDLGLANRRYNSYELIVDVAAMPGPPSPRYPVLSILYARVIGPV